MQQRNNIPSTIASPPWYAVWTQALWPSVPTYEGILSHRDKVTVKTALGWTVIGALINSALLMASWLLLGSPTVTEAPLRFIGCALAPLVVAHGILEPLFYAGIGQGAARALGGAGEFRQLVYAYAAFLAPLYIIQTLLGSILDSLYFMLGFSLYPKTPIPVVWIPFGLYHMALSVIAVKAVHRFEWWKALVSALPAIGGAVLNLGISLFVSLARMYY